MADPDPNPEASALAQMMGNQRERRGGAASGSGMRGMRGRQRRRAGAAGRRRRGSSYVGGAGASGRRMNVRRLCVCRRRRSGKNL